MAIDGKPNHCPPLNGVLLMYQIEIAGSVTATDHTAAATEEQAIATALSDALAGLDDGAGLTTATAVFEFTGAVDLLPEPPAPAPIAVLDAAVAQLDAALADLDDADPGVPDVKAAAAAVTAAMLAVDDAIAAEHVSAALTQALNQYHQDVPQNPAAAGVPDPATNADVDAANAHAEQALAATAPAAL